MKKMTIGKLLLTLLMIAIVVVTGTYAWFSYQSKKSALVLTIGDLNDSQVIITPYEIRDTMLPVNNYSSGVYSQITVINNNDSKMNMELYYKVNTLPQELAQSGLKYTIVQSDSKNGTYTEVLTGDFSTYSSELEIDIFKIKINSNTTTYYRLYLWLDTNYGNQTILENTKLDLELNANISRDANPPILDSGMIPITISNDGTVTTISSDNDSWYDYSNQEWANAVLVTESSRSTYLNTTDVVVQESDILAYYVWIPRYKYKIWTTSVSSTGNEQEIGIIFESVTSPKSNGTKVGEYLTHPAFTFGDEELSGFWVGKFETTGTGDNPTVLPNTTSLRSQNVSTQFQTSLKFSGGTLSNGNVTFIGSNTYGLSKNTDSHMMKNSEWGAVAYLSHSKYGINGEIRINNNYSFITGCGASTENGSKTSSCEIQYGNVTEYPQSTTGNISGIYDMSGGAWEYVMGVYSDSSGNPRSGFSSVDNSGFNGALDSESKTDGIDFPSSKYYDLYLSSQFNGNYSINNSYCTLATCGGYALYETAGWYSDHSHFVYSLGLWYMRGGGCHVGSNAGAFNSSHNNGNLASDISWRSVLIPRYIADVEFNPNGGTISISYTEPGEYTYTTSSSGTYQLEVWGAQGGNTEKILGGYGGYSTGIINLNEDDTIYINIGGQGNSNCSGIVCEGGYNGGGNSGINSDSYVSSGGGATHIATISGKLSTLVDYKGVLHSNGMTYNSQNILIVAGGGGGSANYPTTGTSEYGNGGAGGGYLGSNGTFIKNTTLSYQYGHGGSQLNSGNVNLIGSFGEGGSNTDGATCNSGSVGGGGGWYGGTTGYCISGGGGGSGYIGSSLLTNKYMYCYNCETSDEESTKTYTTTNVSSTPKTNYVKSGDGAARISTSLNIIQTITSNETNIPSATRDGYIFKGWNTKQDGSGTYVTNNLEILSLNINTLYAIWEEMPIVKITYNPNGGIITELIETYTEPGEYTFTVPSTEEYRLEVWGAAGGYAYNTSYLGGYGGYSVGNINLSSGTNLYINVGGKGENEIDGSASHVSLGGYNGGGNGINFEASGRYIAGGGGATHIAIKSGLLSTLSDELNSILIVAGGGAGSSYYNSSYYTVTAGSGGGMSGTSGIGKYGGTTYTITGGTQTSGNSFGLGGTGTQEYPGGGGGFYGGNSDSFRASGGSGYIGNSSLTNKYMYCYNCTTSDEESTKTYTTTRVSSIPKTNYAKSGDGAVKISYVSNSNVIKNIRADKTYGNNNIPSVTKEGYGFVGWNTKADGSGTYVTSDTTIISTEDHTLYAIYEEEKLWLIKDGVVDEEDTGGMTPQYGSESISYKDGYIQIGSISNTFRNIRTVNKIDLSLYTKIYVEYSSVITGSYSGSTYGSSSIRYNNDDASEIFTIPYGTRSKQIKEIDISNLTGKRYLEVCARAVDGHTTTIKYYNVWLE